MIPLATERLHYVWDRFESGADVACVFVADLLMHEVEAMVEMQVDEPIEELQRFVLQAIQLANPATVQEIDGMLHLGRQIVFR